MESEDSVELLLEIPVETISDGEFPDQEEGELDESLSDIRYCIKSVLLCARAIATYYSRVPNNRARRVGCLYLKLK